MNAKLRNKIKDLNNIVEKAIDRANQKKLSLAKKEQQDKVDTAHLIAIRDKEIQNSEKQIRNNEREIEKLQARYNELQSEDNVTKLEQLLSESLEQKKEYEREIKQLE